MKKLFKNIKYIYLALGLAVVIFFAKCGLNPFTIEMPSEANANTRTTFVLHGGTTSNDDNYTTKLLVGIMVPRNWHARQNAVVSFTSQKGDETMSLIPDSEIEPASGLSWSEAAKKRFGIGPNLLDDFEWIVYRSNKAYTFMNHDDINIDVKVECNVGEENMLVKLGFFMGSSKENLRPEDVDYTKYAFSNEFRVENGTGDLIDFINPQLAKVEPTKSTDNDIITLVFDAGVTSTDLDNNDDLYLCVKGLDDNGQQLAEICEQTSKTKLTPLGGKKYRIDFWPKGFLNVPVATTISRLEYYITDATGTKKVGYGNTADPFVFTFKCQ